MSTQSRDELSQITHDLKQSLMQRKPTQSPFENILQQAAKQQQQQQQQQPTQPPTTADIMRDIESMESPKSISLLTELYQLRDLILPTPPVTTSFSPKKKFIIRNQSQTDDVSLNNSTSNDSSFIKIIIDQKPYRVQVQKQETSNKRPIEQETNTQSKYNTHLL
ncbi:unnamed protein product [Didymodactylos carnosus]|uniref:Uncharacterized protein n=1 Tax=Didymodactylos carnosus TaxID=1234261 RepID=A0A8S2HQP7_9BILA|nr:unnamed protein product [Didymodactylos carnosus]CAF3672323.1 unnamed protein product [Didymodactylos carnosus]